MNVWDYRGEVGEVVTTPLAIEGRPLLSYRTGDVSFLIDTPCACGRSYPASGRSSGARRR